VPSTAARILVIEDHGDIRTLFDYLLRAHGHDGYIPKLIESETFVAEIERFLRDAVSS
jgi:CheY-like chemotaxis protein